MNIESIILAAYIISLSILFFFGAHGFNMIYYYFKTFSMRTEDLEIEDFFMSEYPVVTVQIPLYNEQYVITRLIDSVLRMDYPKDKLEVQILDDSTDETTHIIENHIKKYLDAGFDIKHIHRTNRAGFKAGALKIGLETARGEFVAVFDADFIPRKKFLKRTIPYFYKDDKLGLGSDQMGTS